jgi:hypothetical protein
MTTCSGDGAGFLLPARRGAPAGVGLARPEMFAQFLRKSICAAPKSAAS